MSDAAFRCPDCQGFLQWSFLTTDRKVVYKCSRDWLDERLFVRLDGKPIEVLVRVERHKGGRDYYAEPISQAQRDTREEEALRRQPRRAPIKAAA